jgi:hypothetical protein
LGFSSTTTSTSTYRISTFRVQSTWKAERSRKRSTFARPPKTAIAKYATAPTTMGTARRPLSMMKSKRMAMIA